jgi:hypothetical protein
VRSTLGWLVAAVALVAACSATPDQAAPPASSASSSPELTTPPSVTSTATSTTTSTGDESTTPTSSGGALPDQLVPNVVDDECLLTPAQFGSLAGRQVIRAENTELADNDGRRSCFYVSPDDEPLGRTDVYAPAAVAARDLVARVAANSTASRTLTGVGEGAVVVPGRDGSFELVVASSALLVVLTLPARSVGTSPDDAAWSAAATAMLARLTST